jgi:hypothetical protein
MCFPNRRTMLAVWPMFRWRGVGVSQFLTVLLLATSLMLALCFGVAAWRLSDGKDSDISGRLQGGRASSAIQMIASAPQ